MTAELLGLVQCVGWCLFSKLLLCDLPAACLLRRGCPTSFQACERWLPIHTITTIALSVISMLADPNDMSPANVDAAKEWREDSAGFKKRVQRCVRLSQEML